MTASFRDMKLFVSAYEERSFTGAAIREGATQSGVSQHIGKLENLLQVKLFTRDKGRVTATPAGDAYYQRCLEVLRAHEVAHRTVAGYSTGLEGEISVGLMPTMTRCVLAPTLAAFTERHPNVTVRVIEGYSGVLTRQVQSGDLAFAIVPSFSGLLGLKSRLFARTPEVMVSRKGSGVHAGRAVRLADLPPLRLVVPGKGNTRRNNLDTYLASNGVRVDRLLELDAMLGTLNFVADTDWSAVLPALMMSRPDDANVYDVRLVTDPPLILDLILIEAHRNPLSPAAAAFLELLEQQTQRIVADWQ